MKINLFWQLSPWLYSFIISSMSYLCFIVYFCLSSLSQIQAEATEQSIPNTFVLLIHIFSPYALGYENFSYLLHFSSTAWLFILLIALATFFHPRWHTLGERWSRTCLNVLISPVVFLAAPVSMWVLHVVIFFIISTFPQSYSLQPKSNLFERVLN